MAPETEAGRDPYQQLAELVAVKLEHMAESIDAIRDHTRDQLAADAKRLEVYETRWQIDHDGMSELVGEIKAIRGELASQNRQHASELAAQDKRHTMRADTFDERLERIESRQESQQKRSNALDALITGALVAQTIIRFILESNIGTP